MGMFGVLLAMGAVLGAVTAVAGPAGRITGVGGVFFTSRDPAALMAWYRDVLGIAVEEWGGAMLRYDAAGHPPAVVVAAIDGAGDPFAPSTREFMLNFGVDDIDAIVERLIAAGVAITARDDSDPSGRFAWIVDPDGTRIELWQPTAAAD